MFDQKKIEKKFKSHSFIGGVKWTEGRLWSITSDDGVELNGGSPSKLGGTPGNWSPEDLMLASINTCHLSSFTHLCRHKKFDFVSYESEAEGIIEHDGENFRFTKFILKPKIGVKSEDDIEPAREYIIKAHHGCWMGSSVIAEVEVKPEIFVAA